MDFIKLDSTFHKEQLKDMFSRVLYAEPKGNALSVPAKELQIGPDDEQLPKDAPWTAYTLIRIAKKQSAVIVGGDKVLASRSKPGDYAVQDVTDLSGAKVYFVGTDEMSGGMIETHTPVSYFAQDKDLGVSGEIRLQCAACYTYRIGRPKEFMKYALTQKGKRITKQALESEMSSIFSVCMPALLTQLSAEGVPYDEVCAATDSITKFMQEKLAVAWKSSRGVELKEFRLVMAQPNRDDEKAFLAQCRLAEEARSEPEPGAEEFSREFNELMKELGKVAEDALTAFGAEMTSLFDGLAAELEKEFGSSDGMSQEDDEADAFDGFDLDSILDACETDAMGTWECPELGQTVRFELLYAVIETNGQQVWMGDWEERAQEDGTHIVVCPTADALGCYKYMELHETDEGEYLAAILSDADGEKQFVRFVRTKPKEDT